MMIEITIKRVEIGFYHNQIIRNQEDYEKFKKCIEILDLFSERITLPKAPLNNGE